MNPEQWKQSSDVELIIAALVGNLEAFDELAIRFRPAMLTVAEQIVGHYGAAEDVVQDALLLAFKALPQLDDLNRFSSWLYSITRHRALRYLKEEGRFELSSDLDAIILEQTRAIAPDPAQVFEHRSNHHQVREAIQKLPSEYQVVLKLYYWDDMPQQRIADFLALPLTTVKWRLYKAKQMLKTHLEKDGI
jgi:RNA polymerase sigma-70 factor, ECF subfamily